MEAVAYSNFRQNLRSYMKQVNEDAETLIVTSKDVEDTVVGFCCKVLNLLSNKVE